MKTMMRSRSVGAAVGSIALGLSACGSSGSSTERLDTTATSVSETTVASVATTTSVITSAQRADQTGQPSCDGGPTILETEMLTETLVVRESIDGLWHCASFNGNSADVGSIPDTVVSPNQVTNTGRSHAYAWYEVAVSADFPTTVSARNETGDALPFARGRGGDYLLIFDPFVGQPAQTAEPPVMVERTLDLLGADGALIVKLRLQGWPKGEFASFEQFRACVTAAGVDMQIVGPDATLPPRDPTPRDTLDKAWRSCEDLFFSYLEGNGQGGPEFLQNQRFVNDCLADGGYFPMLNERIINQIAYQLTHMECEGRSPARTALVECLRSNGLDVVIDGRQSTGPFDPRTTDSAWQACRDTYAIWSISNPVFVPDMMPRLDCLATKGWLTAIFTVDNFANSALATARTECPQ